MQKEARQKKIINECNDSLGILLPYPVGVLLHQHNALLPTVFDAGFSVDEFSTHMAKITIGLSPDLLGT